MNTFRTLQIQTQNDGSLLKLSPSPSISCAACGEWEPLENRTIRKTFQDEGRQRYEALCKPCNKEYEAALKQTRFQGLDKEDSLALFIELKISIHV